MRRKKIAILRTLGVRLTQAELAASFQRLQPVLIGDLTPEIKAFAKKKRLNFVNLPLKPVYSIDPVRLFLGRTSHQSWLKFEPKKLKRALEEIDVLEIYETYFFYCQQVAEIAKKSQKPLVTEIWTSFPEHPARFVPPYCFNVKRTIEQTNLFILRSHRALNYLQPFKVPERKKVVIYHGVNLKRFHPKQRKQDDKVRILFVGALNSNKGLDDVLVIWPRLVKKSKKKIELWVCGKGEMKNEVLKLAKELPIKFWGWVSHEKMGKIYQQADIFCGPSKDLFFLGVKRNEEFVGYVFMEAMASGLPIVATVCGGIPEVVGKNNFLVRQGNQRRLLKALFELIHDKKARDEIGAKNRKRAEKLFDLKKQVELTEKIILKRFFK